MIIKKALDQFEKFLKSFWAYKIWGYLFLIWKTQIKVKVTR